MNCPKCGAQIPDNSRFCTNCGSPISAVQQSPAVSVSAQSPVEQTPVPVIAQPPAAQAPVENAATVLLPRAAAPEHIPNPMDAYAPAKEYVPAAPYTEPAPAAIPVPVQPVPAGSLPPAPQETKGKKSGGFLRILPWILVGVLVLGLILLGVLGYQEYNAIADERDRYYLDAAQAKDENDRLLDENDRLLEENNALLDSSESYSDILRYAENYNIGGCAEFGAEPAVIYMHMSEGTTSFTLNTKFENGSISMSTYGYSADGDWTEDNWGDSTEITVTAYEPGISLLEFTLDDGSYPTFGVLVIVTD